MHNKRNIGREFHIFTKELAMMMWNFVPSAFRFPLAAKGKERAFLLKLTGEGMTDHGICRGGNMSTHNFDKSQLYPVVQLERITIYSAGE